MALFGICSALLLSVGCGRDSTGAHVHGHVTYRGEAITNGALTFFPMSGTPISAPLNERGEYGADLAPGDYQVIVTVGLQLPEGWREGDPVPRPKFELPPEYTTRARTVLRATVTEDMSDPLDFALK